MISEEYKNDIKTRILKELITCCTAIIPNVILNFLYHINHTQIL